MSTGETIGEVEEYELLMGTDSADNPTIECAKCVDMNVGRGGRLDIDPLSFTIQQLRTAIVEHYTVYHRGS
jgi:hypothetical protein